MNSNGRVKGVNVRVEGGPDMRQMCRDLMGPLQADSMQDVMRKALHETHKRLVAGRGGLDRAVAEQNEAAIDRATPGRPQ